MITSITTALHGSHVDVTLAFTSALEWTALQIQVSRSAIWPVDSTEVFAGTVDGEGDLTLQYVDGTFRLRARQFDPGTETWGAWVQHDYTTAGVVETEPPRSRWVSYGYVLERWLERRGHEPAEAVTEAVLRRAAIYITDAYRYCLEAWRWPDALQTLEVPCTAGIVSFADIFGADYFTFWDRNPEGPTNAQQLTVVGRTGSGIQLCTTVTTVWAQITPRAPDFRHQPVVDATHYDRSDVVYHTASGQMHECVHYDGATGAELTDSSRWRVMRLLWELSTPTVLLALADSLGNADHERGQAAALRRQAEDALNDITLRNA